MHTTPEGLHPYGHAGEREGSASGRRGRARAGLEAAQLRQGAVHGRLPAGPDPPAAEARPGQEGEGRAVPGRPAGVPDREGRPVRDRARGEDPRRGAGRAQGAGRAGHEGARGVRRPGPVAGALQPGADAVRRVARVDLHAAERASVDRRGRAADAVRLRGAEAGVAAQGGDRPHLRLPADRARRGLGPGPDGRHRHPHRGRQGLHDHRPEAVGHQRRDRRRRGVHGQGPQGRAQQGRHQRVRIALRHRRRHRDPPQPVHGPEGHRELGDAARGRLRAGGEHDRQGGRRPEDRPDHAEHRPAGAARHLPRRGQVGHQGGARVRRRAGPVGPAGWQARRSRPEDRLPRRHCVRAGGHAGRGQPPGRRQEERLPDRGGAAEAATAPSSAGRWPTS